jgi:hypothetical protein
MCCQSRERRNHRSLFPYLNPKEESMLRTLALLAGIALLIPAAALAQALPTLDNPIAYAESAGIPEIAAVATILDAEGNVLRQGTNGWTCMAMPGAPMCVDRQWMSWLDAYINQRDEVEVTAVGLAYMLRGDDGASNIDPFAEGPTAHNEWVTTGPHLMIIVPDPALLEGIPTDPSGGGPYVMWRDTPFVHVMIPVEGDAVHLHHPARR